jgi:hypothetical protein
MVTPVITPAALATLPLRVGKALREAISGQSLQPVQRPALRRIEFASCCPNAPLPLKAVRRAFSALFCLHRDRTGSTPLRANRQAEVGSVTRGQSSGVETAKRDTIVYASKVEGNADVVYTHKKCLIDLNRNLTFVEGSLRPGCVKHSCPQIWRELENSTYPLSPRGGSTGSRLANSRHLTLRGHALLTKIWC